MKAFLTVIMFSALLIVQSAHARTVEVEVYGMTCAFCVDSLERKFANMESISKVDVSLKHKKVRLVTDETMPSIEAIKQAVLDAGFTPVKVTVQSNSKE
ncbi:MAG: heavy-metal-associated domain-containing protein [Moritella sp.]|uniref:heavy-metal-associated domain-containing protein n=1 Tax=Moritella sp. TaxID=78556 RepID=UPI00216F23F0|nr:heavy-metal-associated domain-containing protein [Moritella sp.]MBL1418599.1 heavy-metal-associated domain-containing protein [Moritella sp.]